MNETYLLRITGPDDRAPRFLEFPSLENAKMSANFYESYGFECRIFIAVEEVERG